MPETFTSPWGHVLDVTTRSDELMVLACTRAGLDARTTHPHLEELLDTHCGLKAKGDPSSVDTMFTDIVARLNLSRKAEPLIPG
jgi:hypothetical protein